MRRSDTALAGGPGAGHAPPIDGEGAMLGVLGGMGPMATVDFMAKLVAATPAACDQDHPGALVLQASDIPDRTRAILGQGADPLPAMLAALRRLEAAGATRIAIPCNTAHHWHAALQAATQCPILHIVDAVAAALAAQGCRGGPIGLLATDGTLRAGIYPERLARHGYACRVPEDQATVMEAIRLVKAGRVAQAGPILRDQAERLIAAGCDRVVLACTEIPVALADPGAAPVPRPERWLPAFGKRRCNIKNREPRPERWFPAFGKRRCNIKSLEHRSGSGFRDDALAPYLVDATDALARACLAAPSPAARLAA